jgi:seryl-tRNA synthetase
MKTNVKKSLARLMVACLVAVTVACGSGAPGPEADAKKTPAEVKTEVQGQDTSVLEAAVASYKTALDDTKSEAEKLEDQIKEAGGKMLDGLLGDAKADDMKADVEAKVTELEADLTELKAKLEDLMAKLKVYTDELASRV